jgi:hypothetical protein
MIISVGVAQREPPDFEPAIVALLQLDGSESGVRDPDVEASLPERGDVVATGDDIRVWGRSLPCSV